MEMAKAANFELQQNTHHITMQAGLFYGPTLLLLLAIRMTGPKNEATPVETITLTILAYLYLNKPSTIHQSDT